MSWKIPLSDIDFGPDEEAAVLRVIRSRWLTMGEETEAFEKEFAEYIGVKHAVAVANGTAALHLAMLALDLGPNDVVIQPAVNFVATANMTLALGAIPLFADICSLAEPTISPDALRDRLHSLNSLPNAQRPKAVVVMHYGGYPCRMNEIEAICRESGLALIEDACHGVGGSYDNRKMGAWGDLGCFSFFSNKNLVTGEGGMITSDRDDLAEKARLLRSHGMTTLTWDRHRGHASDYDVAMHGYNYRIDEVRSAFGREQLKKLDKNNQLRRELTTVYRQKLEPLEEYGWTIPFKRQAPPPASTLMEGSDNDGRSACHVETKEDSAKAPGSMLAPWNSAEGGPASGEITLGPFTLHESSCHLLPVVSPDPENRRYCAETLKTAGVQTSLHYPFIPSFSAFKKFQTEDSLSKSREFCSRVITLPLYPTMTQKDLEFVTEHLIIAAEQAHIRSDQPKKVLRF